MPLDASGLSIPDFQQLKALTQERILEGTGEAIDFTERSIANNINSVTAAALTDVYELLQAIYDQRDIDKAEGVQLDIMASYRGLTRRPSTSSQGFVSFTAESTSYTIPAGTRMRDNVTGTFFQTDRATSLTTRTIQSIQLSIDSAPSIGELFTIDIIPFGQQVVSQAAYTAQAGDTTQDVAVGLIQSADTIANVNASAGQNPNEIVLAYEENGTVQPNLNRLDVLTYSGNVVFNNMTAAVASRSTDTGQISGTAGTVTVLVDPVATVTNIINFVDFELGLLRETDEDFRIRIKTSSSGSSFGTTDSISTNILNNVPNVRSVNTIENDDEFYQDIDGVVLPPKSYMAIVDGGEADEIAQAIQDRRPAGVRHVGNSSGTARDVFGNDVEINYETPVPVYIGIKVSIAPPLQDENNYTPTDQVLVDTIRQAIKEVGDTVNVGTDIRPTRYVGAVYNAVPSLNYVDVEMSFSSSPFGTRNDVISAVDNRETDPQFDGKDPHCPVDIAANENSVFELDAIWVVNSIVC